MPPKPPSMKPPKGKPAGKPKMPNKASKAKAARVPKTFSVAPLTGEGEGEKILIFGESGVGKTTLPAQLEDAVFVALDDGARKIANPLTGKPVQAIPGVDTFDDLRDAVRQASKLVPEGGSLVIDTLTRAQPLIEDWVVDNVPMEKGGRAKNLEAFGWGSGYRHVLEQVRNLLSDLDQVVHSGRNVILLAQLDQTIVANAGGMDYYKDVPKLIENKKGPIRTEVCEWCDHVFRIGYLDLDVEKDSKDSRVGKAAGDVERAIFTGGAQHFTAKSRPVDGRIAPQIIPYESQTDNTLWRFLFEGLEFED